MPIDILRHPLKRRALIAGLLGSGAIVAAALFFMHESNACFHFLTSEHLKVPSPDLAHVRRSISAVNLMTAILAGIAVVLFVSTLISSLASRMALAARDDAERNRERTLRRFEAAIANTPLVAVQTLTSDGTVRLWNRASERLYGYAAGEATGHALPELLFPGEAGDTFRRELERICGTGRPGTAREWQPQTKTGEKRHVLSAIVPIVEEGRTVEVFCMQIDISAEVAARADLQESVKHLQSYYDMMIGREGRVVELKREINDLCDRIGEPRRYGL